MKKLFLLAVVTGLALSACEATPDKVVKFDNKSSYTVSFVLSLDLSSKTLEPGQTASMVISDGFHGFKTLTITPKPWVEYKQSGNNVVFSDIAPITLEVNSIYDDNVALRAGGYMETEPMTVKKGKDNHNVVYTKTPTFSASYTYPVTVNYVYNAGRNTIYVNIH
jgi:hypothetical protein